MFPSHHLSNILTLFILFTLLHYPHMKSPINLLPLAAHLLAIPLITGPLPYLYIPLLPCLFLITNICVPLYIANLCFIPLAAYVNVNTIIVLNFVVLSVNSIQERFMVRDEIEDNEVRGEEIPGSRVVVDDLFKKD
jgi:hypothetical protein